MTAPTFKPGDRVMAKEPDDFKANIARAIRNRIGIVDEKQPPAWGGNLFIRWQAKPRDRESTIRHNCPAWWHPRNLIHAPEIEQ